MTRMTCIFARQLGLRYDLTQNISLRCALNHIQVAARSPPPSIENAGPKVRRNGRTQ